MATKAIMSEVHLDRQDEMLKFGATAAITSAKTYPCGVSAAYADGTVLDLGNTDLEGMSVIFHVDEAINAGTATFKLSVGDTADGSTWTEIASSPSVAAASLTANKEFAVAIPRGHVQGQYLKATVVATGSPTAGKVSAYVDCYVGK